MFMFRYLITFLLCIHNKHVWINLWIPSLMHRSAKFQTPPNAVDLLDLVQACEGVFLLCFLGQIVTYNIILIYWIKIDHVLLKMIMIDSCGTVHTTDASCCLRHYYDQHQLTWKFAVCCILVSFDSFVVRAYTKLLFLKLYWWNGKPSGSIACTRKQQPRFYWSCSSVVMNDATPLTPPSAWACFVLDKIRFFLMFRIWFILANILFYYILFYVRYKYILASYLASPW